MEAAASVIGSQGWSHEIAQVRAVVARERYAPVMGSQRRTAGTHGTVNDRSETVAGKRLTSDATQPRGAAATAATSVIRPARMVLLDQQLTRSGR